MDPHFWKGLKWLCKDLNINHWFGLVHLPQINDQVEAGNKMILWRLKKIAIVLGGICPNELDNCGHYIQPQRMIRGNIIQSSIQVGRGHSNEDLRRFIQNWVLRSNGKLCQTKNRLRPNRLKTFGLERNTCAHEASYDMQFQSQSQCSSIHHVRNVTKTRWMNEFSTKWEGSYKVIKIVTPGLYYFKKLENVKLPCLINVVHLNKFYL